MQIFQNGSHIIRFFTFNAKPVGYLGHAKHVGSGRNRLIAGFLAGGITNYGYFTAFNGNVGKH